MISGGSRHGNGGVRRLQRGLAAIEFALVFLVLFLFIYGLATVGSVFYVQQAVSRAAEDGARAALLVNHDIANNDSRVQTVIYESLASSLVTPASAGTTPASRLAWLRTKVTPASFEVNISNPAQVTVRVTYPYRANPLLPPMPMTRDLIPNNLLGKAIASRPS
ncbi:Flp pilus assembly protein TadG [Variovorax boronicumulans]|uniref:TadE family protein n=1 Tax=Variovorax boronicumulans TaxID=436515 RepID=UPI002785BACA|nr:TadE/TadG family type IV pilus assembly protein [Variovorax boronicumulans]MDQ0072197.1 Flp pilus assembly protein TadG [Variovorax boronicumulans]